MEERSYCRLIFSTSSPPLQESGNVMCKWRENILIELMIRIRNRNLSGDQISSYLGDLFGHQISQIRA